MRIQAILLAGSLAASSPAAAQSGPALAQLQGWLMPPPPRLQPLQQAPAQAIISPATPTNAARPVAGGPAGFPLGIYASPLMIYAVRGIIERLAAHQPTPTLRESEGVPLRNR